MPAGVQSTSVNRSRGRGGRSTNSPSISARSANEMSSWVSLTPMSLRSSQRGPTGCFHVHRRSGGGPEPGLVITPRP